jgi:putative transposase
MPEIVLRGFQDLLEAQASALTSAQLHDRCPHQRSTQVGDISLATP